MILSAKPSRFCGAAAAWLLAATLSTAGVGIAFAADAQAPVAADAKQSAPDQPAPATAVTPAPASLSPSAAASKPGFLQRLGRWLDDSIADLGGRVKDAGNKLWDLNKKSSDAVKGAAVATQDAMKNTAEAANGAATTVLRLPNTRVMETRERCALAPNGAPDCATAATNACRGKGFNAGQPLNVVSAQKCPPEALLTGEKPRESDCQIETVVTGVVCQ